MTLPSPASATLNPSLPTSPTFPGESTKMADMAHEPLHEKQPRSKWQSAGIAVTVFLTAAVGLGLAAYAAAASYESVSGLAAAHHVPLPRLNPLGIDGGLFGVIAINLALIWAGIRLPWLRAAARLFAAGTIAANAAAGYPDPVSMCLRMAAPVLFVILMETASAVLLHRSDQGEGIPLSRWLLDIRGTWRLWRRMKLWRIRDYAQAVDMELSRLDAIEKLAEKFGQGWQEKVPGNVAWMLRAGVRMDEALRIVAAICAPAAGAQPVRSGTAHKPRSAHPRKPRTAARSKPALDPALAAIAAELADLDAEQAALEILNRQPGISGRKLGPAVGRSERWGNDFKKGQASAPDTGELPKVADPAPATGEQPRVSG